MPLPRVFPDLFPPACATAWGDDRYGLWCEITVKGVVQRLRWIEPGVFWMGVTDEERVSFGAQGSDWFRHLFKNVAPHHRVVLTQGFWLADTACTQALWAAVIGDMPSRFSGDLELPVDSVSWDDVTTKFLPALNQQLTEAEVFLPTEAQWEYACRTGTKTAYHFGETISKDQVNFGGQFTVPVKALSANRWGLYQMHGNVWEWCADECTDEYSSYMEKYWNTFADVRRIHVEESVTSPEDGHVGSDRALRGGSWSFGARWSRSAFRDGGRRDRRNDNFGFRFALRSIEPGRQWAGVPRVDRVG